MTLEDYIGERIDMPFVWGQNDCVLFAIGWLNIRSGRNWLAPLPAWDTPKGALRIVQQLGGLEAEFDRRLTRINPNVARNGDIGLVMVRRQRIAVLFSGSHIVAPSLDGLVFVDRTRACCAWSL